jgi:hypothetical protein
MTRDLYPQGDLHSGCGHGLRGSDSWTGNGAEDVSFTYKSNVKVGDLQVYDLYIDPHMCR